jgi:hypothetical protein
LRKVAAGAVVAVLLGACSSSSTGATQTGDVFLDKVEAVCRDAGAKIRKIDRGSASATGDLRTIIADASDSLDGLRPPSEISKDYSRYSSAVDDEVTTLNKIVAAASSGDTATERSALANLSNASAASDKLVNGLGAIRCRGLIPADALTGGSLATGDTGVTTPGSGSTDSTDPVSTTVTTAVTAPVTAAVTTPDTTPPTTATTSTPATPATGATTTSTIVPADLSAHATAPAGYTWVPFSPLDASGLYANTIIGSKVTSYSAGLLNSLTSSSISATIYEVRLSEDFGAADITAYQHWEGVDGEASSDVVTTGGLTVRQQPKAIQSLDCAVYTKGNRGVSVCVLPGTDGLSLLDHYVTANGF